MLARRRILEQQDRRHFYPQRRCAILVLSRRLHEAVRVGPDIEVRVLEFRGDCVKLGFTAPASLKIFREEMVELRKEQPLTKAEEVSDDAC